MTALVRLAGRAVSWSRGASTATPRGPSLLFSQRRSAFQGARMENAGGKGGGGRGALIVLEGLDRSGKSLQCARLLSFLNGKGYATEGWRFPDRGSSVGKMISAYLANESQLQDRTIHLLFSANHWEKRSLMESKLLGGTTLVVDRYSYSGVTFSAAKGLDIEWCKVYMSSRLELVAPVIGVVAIEVLKPIKKVIRSCVDAEPNVQNMGEAAEALEASIDTVQGRIVSGQALGRIVTAEADRWLQRARVLRTEADAIVVRYADRRARLFNYSIVFWSIYSISKEALLKQNEIREHQTKRPNNEELFVQPPTLEPQVAVQELHFDDWIVGLFQ